MLPEMYPELARDLESQDPLVVLGMAFDFHRYGNQPGRLREMFKTLALPEGWRNQLLMEVSTLHEKLTSLGDGSSTPLEEGLSFLTETDRKLRPVQACFFLRKSTPELDAAYDALDLQAYAWMKAFAPRVGDHPIPPRLAMVTREYVFPSPWWSLQGVAEAPAVPLGRCQ